MRPNHKKQCATNVIVGLSIQDQNNFRAVFTLEQIIFSNTIFELRKHFRNCFTKNVLKK